MNCREFADFVMAYLDRELPPDQSAVFDGHIGECPECLTYLKTYEQTVRLGKLCSDPEGPVPEGVPEKLVQAILVARARGQ